MHFGVLVHVLGSGASVLGLAWLFGGSLASLSPGWVPASTASFWGVERWCLVGWWVWSTLLGPEGSVALRLVSCADR